MEGLVEEKNNSNLDLLNAGKEEDLKNEQCGSKTELISKNEGNTFVKTQIKLNRTVANTPSLVTSCFFLKRRIPWSNLESREVISAEPDEILSNNKVQTNKYTVLNFIPKNIMEQFSKTANIYFLVLSN